MSDGTAECTRVTAELKFGGVFPLQGSGCLARWGIKIMKGRINMNKVAHVRDMERIAGMPVEVQEVIQAAVSILDENYGADRDADSLGGYVIVIETLAELAELKALRIDTGMMMPEYVDEIECAGGSVYTSSLWLLGDDYGVVVVMAAPVLRLMRQLLPQAYRTKQTE